MGRCRLFDFLLASLLKKDAERLSHRRVGTVSTGHTARDQQVLRRMALFTATMNLWSLQ
jgi:hypothetical protein